jgi:hypothetical protein
VKDVVGATMLDHITPTMTLLPIVSFDTVVVPLVALLMSSSVVWRKEHFWDFFVLQRTPFQSGWAFFTFQHK